MATELTPLQVINLAKICQVLAITDRGFQNATKGGYLDQRLPIMLYNERKAVEWVYTTNSADSALQAIANYLYELCYPYIPRAQQIINNQSSVTPTITGPTNQSVTVGATATFSVSVTGTTPLTYQWFLNGVAILGATGSSYSKTNSQLSDSGGVYSVQVSNPAAPSGVFSQNATLTVSAALVGYYYQGTTDYSTNLLAANDNVPYLGTFPIATGQPFTVTFPNVGASQYIVAKYPIAEPTKTNYENPPAGVDSAGIPGLAFNITTIGQWKYIFSRTGNAFALNNTSGQVKFS